MAIRFRKSISLGKGTRLNLGKRSASVRIGGRGAGITFGTAGNRVSGSLPGTGLYYSQKTGANRQRRAEESGPIANAIVAIVVLGVVIAAVVVDVMLL